MQKTTFLFFLLLSSLYGWAQNVAQYMVTFESNWSQEAHPHPSGSLPSSAHWSRLVGATHNADIQFWNDGGIATQGIEDVAELGNNTALFNEVSAAVTSGTAYGPINGPALDTALGTVEIPLVETNTDFPLLTLVSMIAPSPDWMIAINSVSLIDSEGDWIDEIIIDVYPYDAGTDSGPDYTSPNMDTDPHEPISSLQSVSPFSSEKIGTLTINLETILSVQDNFEDQLRMGPNPATDFLEIQSVGLPIDQLEIYSIIGQKVMSRSVNGSNEIRLDLNSLQSGIYLVRITSTENNTTVRKLVKR